MTTTTDTRPEDLRARMVEHIQAAGHLSSSSVEQALRTVIAVLLACGTAGLL